jgi:hypothetical protein
MHHLIFYTKPECHLCEDAYQILGRLSSDIPLKIEVIDITQPGQEQAAEKYGERIPVLAQPNRSAELNWPFTKGEVQVYLTAASSTSSS